MGYKYVIHPGYIFSKYDNDRHFISAPRLANLYGVKLKDCLVVSDVKRYGFLDRFKHLPQLTPRYNGDYKQHLANQKGDNDE